MKEQLIHEIQRKMLPYLNNEQLLQLGDALTETLRGVSVSYGQYILGKPANGLGNRAIYQPAAS